MKKTSHSKNIFIFAIVANLAVWGGYYMLFSIVKEKDKNTSALENTISLASEKDAQLLSAQKLLDDTVEDRREVDSHIVAKDKVVEFLEFVESLGNPEADVNISSIERGPFEEKNVLMENLIIQVTVKGSWNDVFSFLSRAELMPFKSVIEQARLEKVEDKELGDIWRADLRFNVIKFI
ncbi:MAG: hypothetical protein Q8P86_02740 [bacterium]|nr:hypothetical protein [bacterium]